jgi:hypothetical protein
MVKKGIFLATKVAAIAFAATISTWSTDCMKVALSGTVICIIMVVLKIVEWNLFEDSEGTIYL